MPTINGIKAAYLQPPRYGKNESGPFTLNTWEGTKNELLALTNSIEGLGGLWEMEESPSGAKCKLTARFAINVQGGQPEVPVDTWEFFGGHVEKDLLETDIAVIQAISADDKREIRRSIAADDSPAAFSSQAAVDIYNLMLIGVRARIQFAPTLKHTQTVSSNWTIKASFLNVGRIISSVTLASLESLPNSVLFNLPSDTWTGDSSISYGWLKLHPTVRSAALQKTQIEQQWLYGAWSTKLYGALL